MKFDLAFTPGLLAQVFPPPPELTADEIRLLSF
jgi:hypothetical protein